jgi:hypothetical protein
LLREERILIAGGEVAVTDLRKEFGFVAMR